MLPPREDMPSEPINEISRQVTIDAKSLIENEVGKNYDTFEPVLFKAVRPALDKLIYYVKVHVGSNDYIHVKICTGTAGLELRTVLQSKTKDEELGWY
jgi:hypothetical protein